LVALATVYKCDSIGDFNDMNIIKLIKNNQLFNNFEDSEINSIFDCLKGRILKCSRGRILYTQDDEVNEIGIVLQGTAAKFVTKDGGKKEVVEIIGEGEMFGEIDGYNPEKKAKYSVIAAEESAILYITISTIVRQCEKNCTFHQKLLENTLQ
jgi:CRP-like cAMP-binding protein